MEGELCYGELRWHRNIRDRGGVAMASQHKERGKRGKWAKFAGISGAKIMRLWGISKKMGEKVGDSAKNAYLCSVFGEFC